MSTTRAALHRKDTAKPGDLHMSFELGDKSWKLTFGDGGGTASRHTVAAGDQAGVADCIARAGKRFKTSARAQVHSCYEAGRDGWWLHRWLTGLGVDNIVVDAASIEVNRRARRAKTDRLDGDKLLTMLLRHHHGERVWSVLREPTASQEDERRDHREFERLTHERTAHTSRIRSLLVLHNLRPSVPIGGRYWATWWSQHSEQLGRRLREEIERELTRLRLVKEQVRQIEVARQRELQDARQPTVAQLMRLVGIGARGACVLAHEVFGWRQFANRRELAGCIGVAPTPYASGNSHIEQGISKAGNRRARSVLVELAWCWLRLQPESAMTKWFNQRFARGGARMRRIGIVALARRLAIALWRFLRDGELPSGARLKAIQT
ncbi:IS110 family transposase [Ramlibacter sp. RBP-2]|uniref:IS110 family transposase n=1 Tax=Ramlibacter lithotrophicus TaxID=2606681 RepID=A0A7X6DGP9_9BURK|nr:IS110 family transposase [Ramlibacter lithotrophicus]NKE66844.1 IS110 family transposase [Ramlibacter lithotrophicus]